MCYCEHILWKFAPPNVVSECQLPLCLRSSGILSLCVICPPTFLEPRRRWHRGARKTELWIGWTQITECINYSVWDTNMLTKHLVFVCTDFDCRHYYFVMAPSLLWGVICCDLLSNMPMKKSAHRYASKKMVILQDISLFIIDNLM